jgi:hypothetical protein
VRLLLLFVRQLTSAGHCRALDPRTTPQVYFYNPARRRLRLEKLLCLELSRSGSSNGFFKQILDPGGRFASETTHRTALSEVKRPLRNRFRIETVKNLLYNGSMQRPFPNGY